MNLLKSLWFFMTLICLISCNSKEEYKTLNINKFLAAASSDNLSPSDAQVEMLKAIIPEETFQPAPPITDRNFYAKKPRHSHKKGYVEGTIIGEDGKILPGEIVSLSEDGIRMYPEYNGHKTKNTTIKSCTVTQMRRGICTGLSSSGDKVIDYVVRNCVTTGFKVGNEDVLINCSADAKYAEAVCIPYTNAKNASVEINILDSRNGLANNILAKINGTGHHVVLKTADNNFIPDTMAIKLSVWEGYGNFNPKAKMHATNIKLENKTTAKVMLFEGAKNNDIKSEGEVKNITTHM